MAKQAQSIAVSKNATKATQGKREAKPLRKQQKEAEKERLSLERCSLVSLCSVRGREMSDCAHASRPPSRITADKEKMDCMRPPAGKLDTLDQIFGQMDTSHLQTRCIEAWKAKGMRYILVKRGILCEGTNIVAECQKCKDGKKDIYIRMGCCARSLLEQEIDYIHDKNPVVERLSFDKGHMFQKLPKFYPELNAIEAKWMGQNFENTRSSLGQIGVIRYLLLWMPSLWPQYEDRFDQQSDLFMRTQQELRGGSPFMWLKKAMRDFDAIGVPSGGERTTICYTEPLDDDLMDNQPAKANPDEVFAVISRCSSI
ncbi:hypothetical protein BC829DRAFT_465744 [Chytridium lagenaria]|nr:hypothetical protein BC829DRAFT_465744 [Chytridium lagenaria]